MHLEQTNNFELWNQSAVLLNSFQKLDSSADAENFKVFNVVGNLIYTIFNDIREACSEQDNHIVLYHFSKAKSSCLVLNELLISNELSPETDINGFYIRKTSEIIGLLNNYIHLCRINIIINIRQKKR